MATVGWIDCEAFDGHHNGPGHPECPDRLFAIRERLEGGSLSSKLERASPEAASVEQIAKVHEAGYVAGLERVCQAGGGMLDGDTGCVEASFEAARLAAGAVVGAVDRVLDGTWRRAFCSVRPPGHHARPSIGMGFCLFDNVAIAAEAALAREGIERVAILDWDVHHGNGTQEIFWERGDVLFASWHQFPFYPGTGAAHEVGEGEGEGKTVNCPVARGGGDAEYLAAWDRKVRPALDDFQPQLVLVSAGFDADARDPLAGLNLSRDGFQALSAAVVAWADEHCQGRVVSALEGGYDLAALADDVEAHLETMV